MLVMQKITPFLWFDTQAREAAEFYCSVFPDSKITEQAGIVTSYRLMGLEMAGMSAGPYFKPNPSISFSARIVDKDLTKQIWDKLSEGAEILMAFDNYEWSAGYGRCNDKYGVSRQIMYDNRPDRKNELVPSLMLTQDMFGRAQEAMDFYSSIFPDSKVDFVWNYPAGGPDEGKVAHAEIKLAGQQFIIMESSAEHKFKFDEGVSLVVHCKGQDEVDRYRNALLADGGQESQCGWLKDKFGVSRQVTPDELMDAIYHNDDPEKAKYAQDQMMKMHKIVIADLYKK